MEGGTGMCACVLASVFVYIHFVILQPRLASTRVGGETFVCGVCMYFCLSVCAWACASVYLLMYLCV